MNIMYIILYLGLVILVLGVAGLLIWKQYQKIVREAKNYERGLKMINLHISLPPSSTDLEVEGRDQRDVTDESVSQAQVMYNIIASTATKGFRSKIHGQKHISFEIISNKGLIQYYVVAPIVLIDIIKQAVTTAYPSAVLEETRGDNIFNQVGKATGTIGGELSLKQDFFHPIATYQDSKQDAARSILNALSSAKDKDGVAIQLLIRPAPSNWVDKSKEYMKKFQRNKRSGKSGGLGNFFYSANDLLEALWKPPESAADKKDDTFENQLSALEQEEIGAIEEKTRYPGFETLIRIVVSSNTLARSQAVLQSLIASFSVFDRPQHNGFEFTYAQSVDKLITSYVMRFFPQSVNDNVLNSVELATIFHLPNQKDIPTSQVVRQASKQVDGPTEAMTEGLLLGYNEFRGIKKPIRLATNDRRRHTYFIGQTGTGKSVLLENLAYQDMMAGRGFAFIDPHGDSAEKILGMVPRERVDDVIYFDPGDLEHPIGLNLFEFETEDQKDFLIQEGIQMLYRLYDPGHTGIIGPRYEHWFRNAALTIMSDPSGSTFIDIPQVFNDQAFADYKLKFVKDQTVLDFWNKEMAQTTESTKSEILGWFVSKFGAFLSNEMMRNIIGQTKSGFDIKDVMNNNKILVVNLSKGKTGELNSMLLGMIFVMKFQVAAMSRANIPEDERKDFCLYVDEFQNFATDSFESILSEARKYRLNIIVANQFMTQLTDKIRESLIGNVGTMISGRVGVTDAEILVKKFSPTFDTEDLTKLPNYQTVASVLINNVPSAPFSMSLIPPMGNPNSQLRDALKKLSQTRYGRDRRQIDAEIRSRLSAGDRQRLAQMSDKSNAVQLPQDMQKKGFLDDWLERRQQLKSNIAESMSQSTPAMQIGNSGKKPEIGDKNTTVLQPRGNVVEKATIEQANRSVVKNTQPSGSPRKTGLIDESGGIQNSVQPREIDFRSNSSSKNQSVSVELRK